MRDHAWAPIAGRRGVMGGGGGAREVAISCGVDREVAVACDFRREIRTKLPPRWARAVDVPIWFGVCCYKPGLMDAANNITVSLFRSAILLTSKQQPDP